MEDERAAVALQHRRTRIARTTAEQCRLHRQIARAAKAVRHASDGVAQCAAHYRTGRAVHGACIMRRACSSIALAPVAVTNEDRFVCGHLRLGATAGCAWHATMIEQSRGGSRVEQATHGRSAVRSAYAWPLAVIVGAVHGEP